MHKVKEKIDHVLEKVLIVIETIIAIFSVLVLGAQLVELVRHICSEPATFLSGESAVTDYLHHMLNIVIGLEFVKLLMHLTPANILEVLTMAISRGIIVNHGTAVDNLLSIVCIVALFAARRYLIPRAELHKGIDEEVSEPHHHRGPRKHKHKHDQEQDHGHNHEHGNPHHKDPAHN
jgi:hypothetical protein